MRGSRRDCTRRRRRCGASLRMTVFCPGPEYAFEPHLPHAKLTALCTACWQCKHDTSTASHPPVEIAFLRFCAHYCAQKTPPAAMQSQGKPSLVIVLDKQTWTADDDETHHDTHGEERICFQRVFREAASTDPKTDSSRSVEASPVSMGIACHHSIQIQNAEDSETPGEPT